MSRLKKVWSAIAAIFHIIDYGSDVRSTDPLPSPWDKIAKYSVLTIVFGLPILFLLEYFDAI